MGGRAGREPETLHELLDDEGIELHEAPKFNGKNMGGPRSKLLCPQCGGGREREANFYVLFDPDGLGFRYFCHRASCGIQSGRRLKGAPMLKGTAWTPKIYVRPKPPEEIHRPDKMLSYFAGFGISADTVASFGVHRTTRRMPVLENGKEVGTALSEIPVLAYPYREDGALLNVKYKALYPGGAKRFRQEKDAEPSLFNIDAFLNDDLGIFVEGEDDCLAVFECGFRQVTTLADGSPSKIADDYSDETDDDDRYLPIRGNANPRIRRLKRIILAGDMDVAGRNHHEEIARRVGKARCWVVRWPDDCKDAKETLTKRGRDAVHHAIVNAEPYPLAGLLSLSDEAMRDLYHGLKSRRYMTGYLAVDDRINLSDDGQLIVCTGIPAHGKSTFVMALAGLLTEKWEEDAQANPMLPSFHTVVFSAEVDAERVTADLVSQRTQRPFFPHSKLQRVELAEMEQATKWVRKFFSWIDPEGDIGHPMPRLSWLMGMIELAVLRTGAKLVILDPWQEIDDELPERYRKPYTEWIKECLHRLRQQARKLRVNMLVVVHPRKIDRDQKSGKLKIPEGYDLNNSQAFYSMCHVGLTVHRPSTDRTDMLVRTWKSKESRLIKMGDTTLRYDPTTTRVWPLPVELDSLGEPVSQHWQDNKG